MPPPVPDLTIPFRAGDQPTIKILHFYAPQAAIGVFIIVVVGKGLNPGVGSTFTGEEQYIRVGSM
jgi:hypothetical protein